MNVPIHKMETTSSAMRFRTWQADASAAEAARESLERYALKGLSAAGRTLAQGRVAIFGIGAAGGVAYRLLVQAGVGAIDIVDPDRYGMDSFLTQNAAWSDAGRLKAEVQGEAAVRLNPAVQVRAAVGRAQQVRLRDLRLADVLLAAGDNLELALWSGKMAAGLGKPLVQAAVHGETASSIVRGYDLRDGEGSCPRCGLGQRELEQQSTRHGCDIGQTASVETEPTRTQSTICNIAGAMAATEVMKWLTGNESLALRGEEAIVSTFNYNAWKTTLPRDERCGMPHRRWQLTDVPQRATETTLRMLVKQLGLGNALETQLIKSELDWIRFTFCSACRRRVDVCRFGRLDESLGVCVCGEPLKAVPQGVRSIVPPEDLDWVGDKPLAEIGLDGGHAIGIQQGESWHYVFPRCNEDEPNWLKGDRQ